MRRLGSCASKMYSISPPKRTVNTEKPSSNIMQRHEGVHYLRRKSKTYNSRYSHVVTHRSTNLPVTSLSSGERTGSSVF